MNLNFSKIQSAAMSVDVSLRSKKCITVYCVVMEWDSIRLVDNIGSCQLSSLRSESYFASKKQIYLTSRIFIILYLNAFTGYFQKLHTMYISAEWKTLKHFCKTGQEFHSKFKMVVTPFCFVDIERPKAPTLSNGKWIQGYL